MVPATPKPVASPAGTRLPPAVVATVARSSPVATATAGVAAGVRATATARAVNRATVVASFVEEPIIVDGIPPRTTCLPAPHLDASNDSTRWTADGMHILLAYNNPYSEVWAVTRDGSRLRRLAQAWPELALGAGLPFGWMTSFDVTPDGNQVVYATCRYPPDRLRGAGSGQVRDDDFNYELAVVGLDGRSPRRLTRHEAYDNYPAWSPDGTRVAFLSNRDTMPSEKYWRVGLYTMAADGADVQHLTTGLAVAFQPPAWSPDGRSIAVTARRPGEASEGLYLVQADGAGFMRLSEAVSGGSWSPDGTRLAFAKPVGAVVALYTIAADGTDAQRVTTVAGWQRSIEGVLKPTHAWIHTVAWSPDGAKLLYSCGSGHFCVVESDGKPVGGPPLPGDRAVWSPDGARIAVAVIPTWRDRDDRIILYSAAPDGSDQQPLAWQGVGLVAAQAKDEGLATSIAACAGGYVVPAPEANPGLVRDCETLLAARRALFIGKLVNWGSGSPLAQWDGVTVTGAPPRVTGINLYRKELSGTIPPELGALDHLQHLSLFVNYLTGPIPPELGRLRQLTTLWLGGNWLMGCIPVGLKRVPDSDVAQLGLPDCEAGS